MKKKFSSEQSKMIYLCTQSSAYDVHIELNWSSLFLFAILPSPFCSLSLSFSSTESLFRFTLFTKPCFSRLCVCVCSHRSHPKNFTAFLIILPFSYVKRCFCWFSVRSQTHTKQRNKIQSKHLARWHNLKRNTVKKTTNK